MIWGLESGWFRRRAPHSAPPRDAPLHRRRQSFVNTTNRKGGQRGGGRYLTGR